MISAFNGQNNFTQEQIDLMQTWADDNLINGEVPPDPVPDNIYLEDMKVPDYIDSAVDPVGGATHFLFDRNDATHTKTFIQNKLEDTAYKHYYFKAGNYRSFGQFAIENRTGSSTEPITVSLYAPDNDLHPAQMAEADLAQINIYLRYCEWWQFDRMAAYYTGGGEVIKVRQTSNVVINRLYAHKCLTAVIVNHGAHHITTQRCRLEGYVKTDGDPCAMNIRADGFEYKDANENTHFQALYNKFISNEVANINDAYQTSVTPPVSNSIWQYGNVGGLIIHDNDFYVDYIYRGYDEDGVPLPDRGDEDIEIENAIDTKAGSPDPRPDAAHDNDKDNPTIPIIISGNRMWGYDSIHNDVAGGGGSAFIASMFTNGHTVYDNIIFDSNSGITGGSNRKNTGLSIGHKDCEFYNNILYQCGDDIQNNNWRWRYPWREDSGINHNMHDNYIIDPQSEFTAHFDSMDKDCKFQDNKVIDPKNGNYQVDCEASCHADFVTSCNSTAIVPRTGFTDYVFITDKYTNNPRTIRLEGILDPNGTIVSPV